MYFPKSQIVTNLHTNGNEFILLDSKQQYVGYYWKTSQGKYFTGKTQYDLPIKELIPFSIEGASFSNTSQDLVSYYNKQDINNMNYLNLKNPTQNLGSIPIFSLNIPNNQDYKNGEFLRYFCKKVNENIYVEINKDTFDKLISRNPSLAFQLYFPFKILWKIKGDKEQVYNINKKNVDLISFQQQLPMLNKYLKEDYIKYWEA